MRGGPATGHCRPVVRSYLVESYWPGLTEAAFTDGAGRAVAAAQQLRATGHAVEFLGCVLIPDDEVAFWRFASDSRAGVEEVSARAGLPYNRISESVEVSAATALPPTR